MGGHRFDAALRALGLGSNGLRSTAEALAAVSAVTVFSAVPVPPA
ncbi:MAG: hypothetical protein ACKOWF_04760 [Chloroflexota bacterium]